MKLCYRGVSYEHNPLTLEVTEEEIAGKYRGQTWKRRNPRYPLALKPKPHLKYRGVSYGNITATSDGIIQPSPQLSFEEMRALENTHLNSIRLSMQRRLQAAQANGNEELVHLLEEESKRFGVV